MCQEMHFSTVQFLLERSLFSRLNILVFSAGGRTYGEQIYIFFAVVSPRKLARH
jgi:hypothetical protein